MRRRLRAGIRAGVVAGVLSGVPSTIHALATGRSPLESVAAAGTLLAPEDAPRPRLVATGMITHSAISVGWGAVLGLLLPRRAPVLGGAIAGLAIAALDLGVIGGRFPRIRALPTLPQVADHVAYGLIVGLISSRSRPSGPGRPRLTARLDRDGR
jgi:hypothetical protein